MSDINQPANISTFHLRRRTPGSFLLIPCPRQGRSIRCQGQLEGAAAVTLVASPKVLHIQEQPLAIWYTWQDLDERLEIQLLDGPPASRKRPPGGRRTSYIVPDFLVEMTDHQKRLMEVKPSHRLARPKVQRKLAVARQYAAQEGWTFHVVTEKELNAGPLLSNLRLIRRYSYARVDTELLARMEALVPAAGIKLEALLSTVESESPDSLRVPVFHLLATERLGFDPRIAPLNNETLILPGGTISWDPFDSVWAPSGCSTGGSGESSVNRPPTGSSPKILDST